MAENSNIEWTTHTFNPWRGCTKVSDGCKFCYAETLSGRNPGVLGVWGPKGSRPVASEAYWRQPLRWDRAAYEARTRSRVFCASLADVFEGEETMPEAARIGVRQARLRLLGLIFNTPSLDWLLLTKRPENIMPHLNQAYIDLPDTSVLAPDMADETYTRLRLWQDGYPPKNVWLGTSVENQQTADTRIPALLQVPAAVRFLSCEPLLGPVDLTSVGAFGEFIPPGPYSIGGRYTGTDVDWVIVGGESGPNARPMHPDWARSLRDQCQAHSPTTSFFFKQWGEWGPAIGPEIVGKPFWKYVNAPTKTTQLLFRVGKKAAGRLLDGRTWDEFPSSVSQEVA